MLEEIHEKIRENENFLCKLDSAIGDGDHGTTMEKGFRTALDDLNLENTEDVGEFMKSVGTSLLREIGGSTGPLFATIFMSGGKVAEGEKEAGLALFSEMFEKALEDVQKRGGAKPGDKTLVDSLEPAVEGLKSAVEEDMSLEDGLTRAHERAEEGVEATKDMEPKKGRAKYLGERAKGHQDPGATSISLIFKAMKNYVSGKNSVSFQF